MVIIPHSKARPFIAYLITVFGFMDIFGFESALFIYVPYMG